ncbi:G protein pathway suppressor 2-like isoform X1 [Paramormyrops kingsleyae]|uniref:G protein pathway suppressor 2-like isoform X1 n=1 Tax=Paramormyrops kingsleyae TaxID=1676925 RepID=UPI003B972ADA
MPALLERPKLSNAMARALHKHIMRERERKRQEEEEVDKMMEQKLKEEEERKRKKEMEERMSLEETKEQIMKMEEKLQGLQEEKHQLFLQLKKVLHEEEKRRRKEQSDMTTLTPTTYQPSMAMHSGQHLLSIQGSSANHGRSAALLGDRSKQLFQSSVLPAQAGFGASSSEHGQYPSGQAAHGPYGVSQTQHVPSYAPGQSVPASYTGGSQLRGAAAFQAVQYLPHQPQAYAMHGHFPSQSGFIPSASIPLQKQLEHANQQSGFTDSVRTFPLSLSLSLSLPPCLSLSFSISLPVSLSLYLSNLPGCVSRGSSVPGIGDFAACVCVRACVCVCVTEYPAAPAPTGPPPQHCRPDAQRLHRGADPSSKVQPALRPPPTPSLPRGFQSRDTPPANALGYFPGFTSACTSPRLPLPQPISTEVLSPQQVIN